MPNVAQDPFAVNHPQCASRRVVSRTPPTIQNPRIGEAWGRVTQEVAQAGGAVWWLSIRLPIKATASPLHNAEADLQQHRSTPTPVSSSHYATVDRADMYFLPSTPPFLYACYWRPTELWSSRLRGKMAVAVITPRQRLRNGVNEVRVQERVLSNWPKRDLPYLLRNGECSLRPPHTLLSAGLEPRRWLGVPRHRHPSLPLVSALRCRLHCFFLSPSLFQTSLGWVTHIGMGCRRVHLVWNKPRAARILLLLLAAPFLPLSLEMLGRWSQTLTLTCSGCGGE